MRSKYGKNNKVAQRQYANGTTSWPVLWSVAEQMHENIEYTCICFIKKEIKTKCLWQHPYVYHLTDHKWGQIKMLD